MTLFPDLPFPPYCQTCSEYVGNPAGVTGDVLCPHCGGFAYHVQPPPPDLAAIKRRLELLRIAPDDVEFTRYEVEQDDFPAMLAYIARLEAAGEAMYEALLPLRRVVGLTAIPGCPCAMCLSTTALDRWLAAVGRRPRRNDEPAAPG